MRWTAAAKLGAVLLLVVAGVTRAVSGDTARRRRRSNQRRPGVEQIAGAIISAFFAFGGWWELGRMSDEVRDPRRTMPRALLGGVALVTAIYALVSIAFVLVVPGGTSASDDEFVLMVGAALFGPPPDACCQRWSSWPWPEASRRCCWARLASTWRWRATACFRRGWLDSTRRVAPRPAAR